MSPGLRRERGTPPAGGRRALLGLGAGGLALCAGWPFTARAAAARSGPMRILCSGPAGSIPDLVARAIAEPLVAITGRPVIVDNRPGAAGQISVAALKAAGADASTLLLAQGAIATIYPDLYPHLAYDPAVDLQPVTLASEMLLALAIGPAVPTEVTTLAAFLDWMRRHPERAHVGSPGTGTLPHLLAALLLGGEGIAWQHVAYAGGPPAVTDLLGGQIAALVLPEGLLRQHQASGRLRVLATSGSARSAYLPTVPSFVEAGHPDLVVREWFAFFAAGAMPRDSVEAWVPVLRESIAQPVIAASFAQAGMSPVSCSPAALSARISAERQIWAPVLRLHGIRAD